MRNTLEIHVTTQSARDDESSRIILFEFDLQFKNSPHVFVYFSVDAERTVQNNRLSCETKENGARILHLLIA